MEQGTHSYHGLTNMRDIELYQKIEDLFDEYIRPALMNDGGNIELIEVDYPKVVISFQGACGECPSSAGGTLRGIQNAVLSIDKQLEVVPTNSYSGPATGQIHPFGGETYAETIARKEQFNENNIQEKG